MSPRVLNYQNTLHADPFQIRRLMIGNPNPSLAMIPQPQTLTLTVIFSLLFSSASSQSPSPSPSPSPLQGIMSDPIGALRHPPPLPEIFPHRPPPPLCPSDRIECLERHHGNRHPHVGGGPPTVKNEKGKLNFGQKIGIVFATAAILLQVVLGGFLVYKRVQLQKLDKGTRLASGSS